MQVSIPVVLLLSSHPGGELGAIEGDVEALEGGGEAELQSAGVQVQRRAKQLFQGVLRSHMSFLNMLLASLCRLLVYLTDV